METSLPGKGGQHLVCIRLRESFEAQSLSGRYCYPQAGGWAGCDLVRNWQLLPSGSSEADRKEEGRQGRRE